MATRYKNCKGHDPMPTQGRYVNSNRHWRGPTTWCDPLPSSGQDWHTVASRYEILWGDWPLAWGQGPTCSRFGLALCVAVTEARKPRQADCCPTYAGAYLALKEIL